MSGWTAFHRTDWPFTNATTADFDAEVDVPPRFSDVV